MMMAGRMGRTRPRSSLQNRPGSSAGRPESRAASRAESRAGRPQSRIGPRPRSSIGERPESRLNRTESRPRLTRQDSALYERPSTAHGRMGERIDILNETRAQQQKVKENEQDVDCSTKLKALWLLFSGSILPKAFVVVGGVVFLFGIVMTAIGFATDSFNAGQTVGPALAGVGLILLIIGLLGFKTAHTSENKVGQEQDVEKGKSQNEKITSVNEKSTSRNEKSISQNEKTNGILPSEKTNGEKLQKFAITEDSDNGSDSDVDIASKPFSKSKFDKKDSLSARSDQDIPVVGAARPRTLPPLQMPSKPAGQKKKKKSKTPRKNSSVRCGANNTGYISTVSSGYSYGISGVSPGYGNDKTYGSDNDDDDWTSSYRSKTFNYE